MEFKLGLMELNIKVNGWKTERMGEENSLMLMEMFTKANELTIRHKEKVSTNVRKYHHMMEIGNKSATWLWCIKMA